MLNYKNEYKEIPDDIEFSDQLLLTPSLREMGLPIALAATPYVVVHAPVGSWIDRGDALCTYFFEDSRFDIVPNRWQSGLLDLVHFPHLFLRSFTLKSPISGFCMEFRRSSVRKKWNDCSLYSGLIDYNFALPSLLIPDDEPRWNSYQLQSFWDEVSSHVKRNWKRNIHNTGMVGGYKLVIMGKALESDLYNIGTVGNESDVTEDDIAQANAWGQEGPGWRQHDPKWIVCSFMDYCNLKHYNGGGEDFYNLNDNVNSYRAGDPKLRRKLRHLSEKVTSHVDKNSTESIVKYDIFISHASEDKDRIARPLYETLKNRGVSVWFDEAVLKLGDGLRRKIDEGLSKCKFGVVILSPSFLSKEWPQRELDGLMARETVSGKKAILPIWHEIDRDTLFRYSPTLADKLAGNSKEGLANIVEKILDVLK